MVKDSKTSIGFPAGVWECCPRRLGGPPLSVAVFTRSWAPTLALAWERTEAPQAVETCQFSSPEGGSDSSPGFEEKFCFSGESFFMSDPSTKHDRKKADSLFKGLVDFTH